MKPILVVAPTPLEISVIEESGNQRVETLTTGIGPVKLAMELTMYLANSSIRPGLLILIGLCGVFKGETTIGIGDIVIAKSETFGDMGRCSNSAIDDIILNGSALHLTYPARPTDTLPIIGDQLKKLPRKEVDMATVMCSSSSFERASIIQKRTGAQCENMEGAAFFMVSNRFNVPFVEIRAISNIVGENRDNWDFKQALASLKSYLRGLLG